MKKKNLIICAITILGMGIVGIFLPEEEVEATPNIIVQEDLKQNITEDEFNEKLEYFNLHLQNRNNNLITTDINTIDTEIKLCNSFTNEIIMYMNDYNLNPDQKKQLEEIVDNLNSLNVSYNTNKVKIKNKEK